MEAMGIDWGEAWQVSGIGFGLVFLVLAILAVAIWLTGILIRKLGSRRGSRAAEDEKEEPPPQPAAQAYGRDGKGLDG